MATIIQHSKTGQHYILLGAGYGMFRSTTPGLVFGNWSPDVKSGRETYSYVCDGDGKTYWIPSDEVVVVEVDGKSPADCFLPGYKP